MAYQVLARKWRPRRFEEVIGQDHITRTLSNAINSQKVAHAYLLTGTRGVGKTTIARIFAKALMCPNRDAAANPCLECESCLEVDKGNSINYIEIDGASNNGVDDIRDLVENVQYLPTQGEYKVYVIDEVHMLTVNAFNALLKTLEEPPAHVKFVFATTDPQKLLGTVLSRCQRLDFKHVKKDMLAKHLTKISDAEGINFQNKKIIERIANQGNGSVRDALSLMDQIISLSSDDIITDDTLTLSLGMAKTTLLASLIENMLVGNKSEVSKIYQNIIEDNIDLKNFSLQMLDVIYGLIDQLDKNDPEFYIDNELDAKCMRGITYAEILWTYEAFAKDIDWALSSLDPVKTIGLLVKKVAARRELFGIASVDTVLEKKKPEVEEKAPEPVKIEKDLSWEGFIKYLYNVSPAIGANIERGNILSPLNLEGDLYINIGFAEDNSLFQDFLKETETLQKLKELIKDYFEKEKIKVDFQLIDLKTKEEKQFLSKVEIHEKETVELEKERTDKILNDPYVVEAQSVFNTKVDKVILNK